MIALNEKLSVRLAETESDIRAAQRLRYDVFIEELGAKGANVDHENRLETDRFDAHFDHLLLRDQSRQSDDQVVGVYRLLRSDQAAKTGGFYSETEYDLTPLKSSGRPLLELGRSCLHADYRGGQGMYLLWNALADYVTEHSIEVLFGVASFHGTDVAPIWPSISYLHHNHLAPDDLRVASKSKPDRTYIPPDDINRLQAMKNTPSLIKAYLKMGGFIGEGVYIDRAFNTTDVCLILDTKRMSESQKRLYFKGRSA
ncbi:ornithine-acyl-ACP acyltransferase [Marivivens niveibacter]|uniref:L-ornithine N(alpha)-acyltransferase n=1 Tax=Marivivens niveibacter TaxID=1930667 RepID=A0A251X2N5_9RHOB|nr:GNAT family N-acyltransferase [Marivivens niveibacter]OUD10866.1 ornithine-acyl-ACP acyltransferase [Marivivens niveibacter]